MMPVRFHVDMEDDTDVFAVSDSKSATLDLPADPTELPPALAEPREDADALIASMADQQIEQMLADADRDESPAPAEIVTESGPSDQTAVPVAPDEIVDAPALEPQAALDAVKEAVADSLDVAVGTTPATPEVPAPTDAPVEPPADQPVAAADVATDVASPAPEVAPEASSVEVTTPAAIDQAPSLVAMTRKLSESELATADGIARSVPHDEPPLDSAAAVAKELAEDAPRAVVAEAEAESEPVRKAKWLEKAIKIAIALPLLPLHAMNYPFRDLSDRAREVIAAIALMTLFNSVAILIYVIAFR